MLDINKNKGFIITIGGAVVLLIAGIVLWRSAVGKAQEAADEIISAQEQYQSIIEKYSGEPTKKLVDAYKQKSEDLAKMINTMFQAIPESKEDSYTPSSFKGEIKNVRDEYIDISAQKNIRMPEDIGFSEFLGPQIPAAKDLPKYVRQFDTIKDVLKVLTADNVKVEEITVIDRNPAGVEEDEDDEDITFDEGPTGRPAKKDVEEKEVLYDSVPVQFELRTTPDSFYTILAGIRNSSKFYRINKITDKLEVQAMGEINDPSDISEVFSIQLIVDNVKINKSDK